MMFLSGFMTKNPARRLGCIDGEDSIRKHPFFKDMDWDLLEQRKVRPPFRPKVVSYIPLQSIRKSAKTAHLISLSLSLSLSRPQRSARDAVNFDTEFTREEPVLTPVPADIIRCINQDEFAGFSFVNKEFGPERRNLGS
jgi:novel protein kinase C epsilon type